MIRMRPWGAGVHFAGAFSRRPATIAHMLPRKIPALTGIRGIAACWVVFFHIGILGAPAGGAAWPVRLPGVAQGWVGVDLFFILSGFILMHAHMCDFAGSPFPAAPRFYRARFLRVYPLSAVALILIALLVGVDQGFANAYAAQGPGNLSPAAFLKTLTLSTRWMLPGEGEWNEPVWSLSVEVLGYLAFPMLAFALCRISTAWVSAAIALGCLIGFLLYLVQHGGVGANVIFGVDAIVRMAYEFGAGMALYRCRILAPDFPPARANGLALAAAALTIAFLFVPRGEAAMPFLFCGLIFSLSYNAGGMVDRFLGSRIIVYLGRISFPLYLIHAMPLRALHHHAAELPLPYPVLILAYGVAVLALATVLHLFVERPFNALAHARSAHAARSGGPVGEPRRS